MRSYSTPESAHLGQVTRLAIAEVLLSIALYVWVCTHVGSWRSLSLIVVGAPMMLFRTEEAAGWALGRYRRWAEFIDRVTARHQYRLDLPVVVVGFFLLSPVVGIALRVAGTVSCFVRMPLHTLREAPKNWFRQTLCTDFMHPPEIVPMETLYDARHAGAIDELVFAGIVRKIRQEPSPRWRFLFTIIVAPVFLIGFLPSAVYRVSFKATSLVYAPFIWAAHATIRTPLPLKMRLERITKGEMEKVRRGFSWIVIGTLAAKAGLSLGLVDANKLTETFATARAAELFLVPGGWPWWQLTLAIDALLTFILLFFSDAALARLEGAHPWPERTVLNATSTISFVRVTLSLLTIAHFFGVALRSAFPAVAWPW